MYRGALATSVTVLWFSSVKQSFRHVITRQVADNPWRSPTLHQTRACAGHGIRENYDWQTKGSRQRLRGTPGSIPGLSFFLTFLWSICTEYGVLSSSLPALREVECCFAVFLAFEWIIYIKRVILSYISHRICHVSALFSAPALLSFNKP